jgi:O-antigen/teichoic acid export membrane protein
MRRIAEDGAEAMQSPAPAAPRSFAKNVLWSWSGAAVGILSAMLLTPYMTRRLGDEGYGVWVLAFSLVENFWLLDLGFRSATAKYTAHYMALGETHSINRVISAAFGYFLVVAVALGGSTILAAPWVAGWFSLEPQYREPFTWLVRLVGMSWVAGAIGMVFHASLEGFQRFDLVNRVLLVGSVLRVAATVGVLLFSRSLTGLGLAVLGSQVVSQMLLFRQFRGVFPQLRLGPQQVDRTMLQQLAGYGVHTVVSVLATHMLQQAGPLLLGLYYPARMVGYLNAPTRLMQLTGFEIAARVGVVSGSKAAELAALGDWPALRRLAVVTNRYCLALFLIPAVALAIYGAPFLGLWLGPAWAQMSGPLLAPMIASTALGVAAQFNSSSILFGLARHAPYARGMLAEGVLNVALLWWMVPRYGLRGAVWTSAVLLVLNRGLWLPWVLCRVLGIGWLGFLREIWLRPAAALAPVLGLGLWLRSVWSGERWVEVILAGGLLSVLYAALAAALVLVPEHRAYALGWVRRISGRDR